jgi:hypothetical protein
MAQDIIAMKATVFAVRPRPALRAVGEIFCHQTRTLEVPVRSDLISEAPLP